jgi:tetratricopeptide (TPR) repeat protein
VKRRDWAGCQQACADLLNPSAQKKASVNRTADTATVAWTCSLAAGATRDPAQVARLAGGVSSSSTMKHYPFVRAFGASVYRAGGYREAVQILNQAKALKKDAPSVWLLLAMSHQRLGNQEEARRQLAQATAWIERARRAGNLPALVAGTAALGASSEGPSSLSVAALLGGSIPALTHSEAGGNPVLWQNIPWDERLALLLLHHEAEALVLGKNAHEVALDSYEAAVSLNPNDPLAHYNLGRVLAERGERGRAVREYRRATEINPKYVEAHNDLGTALYAMGKQNEAIAEYREALRLKPDYPEAHNNLGNALQAEGRLDEAIAQYREALRLKKDNPEAHTNLGVALANRGEPDEAIKEWRRAIEADPGYAAAHGALGSALLQLGRFAEAKAATRRALDLLPDKDPMRRLVVPQLRQCERCLALDEKLLAILKGDAEPATALERLELASLCQMPSKRLHTAAARFYAEAFAADPKLAGDQMVYASARSAALAAAGQAADAQQLPDKVVATLRRRAWRWLRADLKAYTQLAERGDPGAKEAVRQRLRHWQQDPDLASVRDPKALDRLPDDERRAWRRLWDDVAALLAGTRPAP